MQESDGKMEYKPGQFTKRDAGAYYANVVWLRHAFFGWIWDKGPISGGIFSLCGKGVLIGKQYDQRNYVIAGNG